MPGDGDLPTVEPQVAPSADLPLAASPQAMGVGIGQAVESGGMVAARINYDEKTRDQHVAQIAAQEGAHSVVADDQDALHGKDGIMYQEAGIGAPKAADDYLTKRAAKVALIRAGLPSDQARQSFDLHESVQRASVQDQLSSWQHSQVNQADAKALQVSGQLHLNEAIIGAGEPDPAKRSEMVNTGIAKGSMDIIDFAQRHNWDKDRTNLAVQEYSGNVVSSVVKSLVDSGDHQAAAAFFADHGEDVTGEQSMAVKNMLRVSGEQDQGYRLANDIIAKQHVDSVGATGPADESKITLGDALARLEAKGITDAKVHDEAQRRIVTHFDLQNKAHTEGQSQVLSAAVDAIDADSNPNRVIPPSALVGMDPRTRKAAEAYAKARIKDGEPVTDDARYKQISDLMADSTQWKATFGGDASTPGSYDLNQDRANLSPTAFRHLQDEIKTIRQKVTARDETWSQGQVAVESTNKLFEANGMAVTAKPGTPARQAQEALQGRFLQQLHKAVAADQITKQRPLTPDEVDAQAQKLLAKQTWQTPPQTAWEKFSAWPQNAPLTRSARAFEAPSSEKRAYSVDDIPSTELQKMRDQYAKVRSKPTPEMIVKAYNDTVLKAKP